MRSTGRPAIRRLKERFGIGEELIETYFHPYVHLDRAVIAEHGLDRAERRARGRGRADEDSMGVSLALTRDPTSSTQRVPATAEARRVLRNHHPRALGRRLRRLRAELVRERLRRAHRR